MTAPLWVAELAAAFWDEAGEPGPFPRNLRRAACRAFPLSVVDLAGLSLNRVLAWLDEQGIRCPRPGADRPLRACLVARRDGGIAFLDAADPEDERRFSLAHELAHFLCHYWGPRRRAAERLGAGVLEVFDGVRPPSAVERVRALLANVAVGLHTHLMERGPRREVVTAAVAAAEEEADCLAYELLAPADAVLGRAGAVKGEPGRTRVAQVLREHFGLPGDQAEAYAGLLLPARPEDPLLRLLGKSS